MHAAHSYYSCRLQGGVCAYIPPLTPLDIMSGCPDEDVNTPIDSDEEDDGYESDDD
jgi:hypothetical protein